MTTASEHQQQREYARSQGALFGLLKNPDWIYRMLMLGLTGGLYYLQTNFLSKAEFQREKEVAMAQYRSDQRDWKDQLRNFDVTLHNVDVSIRLFEANKSTITDHENRLRELERRLRVTDK